ncbi:DNA cytosine methyltransferase [Dysgonomonas sp. Marseille-P4677]|uniref:DNA cytosine methyltransferase n=1 Tax=Dysgonomonas sp. Marseille-P4677 TaxID=2364790 RepID=UPI0019135E02|nr:DNA cytosine methyltransferase [Dysgonomonas sp. Marseille-P4677]MBK5723069.1 DNA cytosine methyltransferase [Dysgonomonas sp. Marseille-P4677]
MKILNCYAGIGGNRKLWEDEHEITAVELDEKIAAIYQDLFPNDTVIIGDAHQYLLEHYKEFEDGFIWASPPCPTHSILNYGLNAKGYVRYPDMILYQEIILLKTFFKGKYCIENVKSYYDPLIQPQVSGRHYYWANFNIPNLQNRIKIRDICGNNGGNKIKSSKKLLGFDLSNYDFPNKEKLLRNCVDPLIGKAILDKVLEIQECNSIKQGVLF